MIEFCTSRGLAAAEAAAASLSKSDASLSDGDVASAERLSRKSVRSVAFSAALSVLANGTRDPISLTALVSVEFSNSLAVAQNDEWRAELSDPLDETTVTSALHAG
jgi:hypothetical protein